MVFALRQLSAFRRRQPDLLTLPTLSVNDVANLIAAEVEKRGYEGVGSNAPVCLFDAFLGLGQCQLTVYGCCSLQFLGGCTQLHGVAKITCPNL